MSIKVAILLKRMGKVILLWKGNKESDRCLRETTHGLAIYL